jgi:hypothetical protein
MRRSILIAAQCLLLGGIETIPAAEGRNRTSAQMERFPVLNLYTLPGYRARSFEKSVSATSRFADPSHVARVLIASGTGARCGSSLRAGGDSFSEPPDGAAAVWRIEARLVSADSDTAVFDLRWNRTVHHPQVRPAGVADFEHRIELKDGAQGILDLVRGDPEATDACPTFAIGLGMTIASGADLPRAALKFDLWLIHRYGDGREEAVRADASAEQGSEANYVFSPLRLAIVGSRAESHDLLAEMNVSGSIIGRARQDGSIDLAVDTWRAFSLTDSGGFGSGGRKRLSVKDGETIEFELPAETNTRLPAALKPHRTALRVTARRLW